MKEIVLNIIFICVIIPRISSAQSANSFYDAFNSFSADSIRKHLYVLGNDSLEGRGVGLIGCEKAALYIEKQFEKYGLKKIGNLNSYFQNIPMHGSIPLSRSELNIITNDDTLLLDYFRDYFLFRSGQQTFIPTSLPLVFVGYGIVAPEFDYNDYQSVNVEGKIVVYLDGEPYSNNENYFDGSLPTIYSYSESKRRIALSRGAAGTIEIPVNNFESWEKFQRDFSFEDVTLAYSVSSSLSLLINPEIGELIFNGSKYSFNQIIEMNKTNKIESFQLKSKLKFRGSFKERDFISSNVIGMIEGSNEQLKDSYLIISAHYDHLGIGPVINGDSVYNGVLDNAAGVSVLLELARTFSLLKNKPERSLVFIATTGEEKGLLGSIYYTDHPAVPLYKTIADINIDGTAMFKDFKSLVCVGCEMTTLQQYLLASFEKYGLELQEIPSRFNSFDAFNKSDQLAFALAGIPSILILEGSRNRSKTEDNVIGSFIDYYINIYHTPFDDLNQQIDTEAALRHAKIIFDLAFDLLNSKQTPEWNKGTQFINARLRSIAEKK